MISFPSYTLSAGDRVGSYSPPIVLLNRLAHHLAEKLGRFARHPYSKSGGLFAPTYFRQAERVYLNTLAVYAVEEYLHKLGFETDWEASDSQNESALAFLDVADLEVKGYGKLECRPVMPGETRMFVPDEVRSNRIGYVAVLLDPDLNEAVLLGFAGKVTGAWLPVHHLQQLSDLVPYLRGSVPVAQLSPSQDMTSSQP